MQERERWAEVAHAARLSRVSARTSLVHAWIDATSTRSAVRVRATSFVAAWQYWHGALAKAYLWRPRSSQISQSARTAHAPTLQPWSKRRKHLPRRCRTACDMRSMASTARSFERVWPAGRPRPGRSKQRRAHLRSLQPAHPGCCGACLTSRSGHREPERGCTSHRAPVLSDAKQRLGVLLHTLSPSVIAASESGIRDEPIQ